MLGRATRADRADRRAFRDALSLGNPGLPEVRERHRVPVGRRDRHSATMRRNGADERNRACRRCRDRLPVGGADVDPAVLSSRVRVGAERERPEHLPTDRPLPGPGTARDHEDSHQSEDDRRNETTWMHAITSSVHCAGNAVTRP